MSVNGFPYPDELTPDELRAVCENPAFRALAAYCSRTSARDPEGSAQASFDRDELGIDPEDDYDLYEED